MPGLPLFALTRRSAFFRFSRSHTASINELMTAGRSGSRFATTDSASPPATDDCASSADDEDQLELFGQPLFGHESCVLVATPFIPLRGPFGPSAPFPARPICCSAFRRWSASLALPTTNLLCPLLTSAPRSGTLAAPSVLADTMQISRGKLDRLHRTPAESTALALMDTGLRRYGPARPTRDASYSVSVRQVAALLPRFFQTAPRGHRPCASLALRLHQTLGRGLSPPSCQTCSAHPEPWTHRTRPPLLGKPQSGFHRPTRKIKKKKSEQC